MNDPTTTPRYDLERLLVSGSPRAMGRAQGEHWRDRIRAFLDVRFAAVSGYCTERGRASGASGLLEVGAESMGIAEAWDAVGMAEHRGIAEGAGVDVTRLYTATNMTDLRDVLLLPDVSLLPDAPLPPADAEGCSAVLVPAARAADGHAIAGQTWDLNATDVDFVVAVHRRPDEGPESWSVSCVGCLTLMGFNARGLAVGTTNIKTRDARPGAGYLSVLHRLARCASVDEAEAVFATAPLAGAHTYWMADAERQVEWEASPSARVARDTAGGPICRTNHCISDAHAAMQGEPTSDSSAQRFEVLAAALSADQVSVDDVRALFGDRSRGVLSVNRYPEDAQGTATNACFVAVPALRRLHACRGPADRGVWHTLGFAG